MWYSITANVQWPPCVRVPVLLTALSRANFHNSPVGEGGGITIIITILQGKKGRFREVINLNNIIYLGTWTEGLENKYSDSYSNILSATVHNIWKYH